jgi:hypothetical protein
MSGTQPGMRASLSNARVRGPRLVPQNACHDLKPTLTGPMPAPAVLTSAR